MGWPFLKGGGRSLLLREWVVVVFISLRRCFPAGAAEELNVVRDALGDGAFVPVLVLVAAVLPCSNDGRLSALGEVAGAEVGGVPPRDDVYKIDGPVAVFVLVVSLNGEGETASGDAAAGDAAFRVFREIPDENDLINACAPFP